MPARSKKKESKKKPEKNNRFASEKEKKQVAALKIKTPAFVPTVQTLSDLALRRMYVALSVEIDPAKIAKALNVLTGYEEYLAERDKPKDILAERGTIKKLNPQILKVLRANGLLIEDIDGEAVAEIGNIEIKQIQQNNEIHN